MCLSLPSSSRLHAYCLKSLQMLISTKVLMPNWDEMTQKVVFYLLKKFCLNFTVHLID